MLYEIKDASGLPVRDGGIFCFKSGKTEYTIWNPKDFCLQPNRIGETYADRPPADDHCAVY